MTENEAVDHAQVAALREEIRRLRPRTAVIKRAVAGLSLLLVLLILLTVLYSFGWLLSSAVGLRPWRLGAGELASLLTGAACIPCFFLLHGLFLHTPARDRHHRERLRRLLQSYPRETQVEAIAAGLGDWFRGCSHRKKALLKTLFFGSEADDRQIAELMLDQLHAGDGIESPPIEETSSP